MRRGARRVEAPREVDQTRITGAVQCRPNGRVRAPRHVCQVDERVRVGAAQRRGEDPVERELIERVGERLHVGGYVGDLWTLEEAVACARQRRVAAVADRGLVDVDCARGARQDDDLRGIRLASLDDLVNSRRQQAGFSAPPERLKRGAKTALTASRTESRER